MTGKTYYEPLNAAPATGTNQLNGYSYDAAGNLTNDGTSYTYDAESRLSSTSGYTYTYDGDGQRVKKANSSTGTLYWMGSGNVLGESDLSGSMQYEYVFFNGKRVARRDISTGNVHYYFADHLGSTRVTTSDTGSVEKEWEYYPYGGEIPTPGSNPNHYLFTGKERDSESGLDNFESRYMTSAQGRFTSPDDGSGGHEDQPQSWNLYSYVQNNPLTNTDPDGHDCIDTTNFSEDGTVTVTRGDSCASNLGPNGTYVNGTVDTSSITADVQASGTMFGYNFTSYDGQSGGVGVIAQAPAYGPLEGPANLAGANMIGNGGMAVINEFMKQAAIGAVAQGVGQIIGLGVDALQAARAAKAAEALAVAERVTQHAFAKHAGEFGNITRNEFQTLVQETMVNPSKVRVLSNGRTAYWSDSQQMVVIENGAVPSQSTAFRPTGGRGYFDNLR